MNKTTILYCPDIECDSCVALLSKTFNKTPGVHSYVINNDAITLTYDPKHTDEKKLIKAIKDRGYRASTIPILRKTLTERAKEFMSDKKKYAIEYTMLKYSGVTLFILLFLQAVFSYFMQQRNPAFLATYGWWLFYLTISIVALAGALWHLKAYRTNVTMMVGMMVGMTLGMQTGMLLGAVFGAVNGFFIGALIGMLSGTIIGSIAGYCCGIMGLMEGMMAGLMGGTMGSMITIMMWTDHLFWFMPPYVLINLLILLGLSYMLFEESVEGKDTVQRQPLPFSKYFLCAFAVLAILTAIMVLSPLSIFLQ